MNDRMAPEDTSGTAGFSRRNVLKTVGAGAVGATVLTGTASAWKFQFYGCSQVCSDSNGAYAVVSVGGDYETRELDEQSQRQNQEWKWESWCYEVSGDESVVAVIEKCAEGSDTTLCFNPNNCASNHYSSEQEVFDAVQENSNLDCVEEMEIGGCDTSGTGGGNGNGNRGGGNGNGNQGGGNGNGNQGGGNGNQGGGN